MQVAEKIEQTGRRIGGHAWLAARLFEVLGRWSGTVDDPRARALLATASRRSAWHAELFDALLPGLPHLPAALLVTPGETAAALVARLDALDGAPDGERVEVLVDDAIPQVIARLETHLGLTTPIADGPTIRVIGLVLTDLRATRETLSSWVVSRPRSAG